MKKILQAAAFAFCLVLMTGCSGKDDSKKEQTIDRQWENVVVEFGEEYYNFSQHEYVEGLEEFKSMKELDALDKLDYKEYNGKDLGDEIMTIKLTEDGATRNYTIYEEWVSYYTDFDHGSFYAKYSEREIRELMVALLPVIGDRHYFSEEENFYIEPSEETNQGFERFYGITTADTFSEMYYITGDVEGEWIYNRAVSGNYMFYMEYQFEDNDVGLTDTKYFHDLITDGDIGYERYSEIASWNKIDMSKKDKVIPIIDNTFLGTKSMSYYDVHTDTEELVKGVYAGDDKVYVAYFTDAGMKSIFYDHGQILYGEYFISIENDCMKDELIQYLYACQYSVQEEEEPEEEFSYSYEFNEKGVFDFDAPIYKGESIDNPHIVESYMDLFAGEEFTVYLTSRRADGYMEYTYATALGDDYFMESAGQMYGEKAIIHREILYDDLYYASSFYENEEPEYYTYSATEDYMMEPFINSVLQYDYTGNGEDEFIEAYYVTINDEEYVCERWKRSAIDVYVYCKDGEIVAIKEMGGVGNTDIAIEYVTLEADETKITNSVEGGIIDR